MNYKYSEHQIVKFSNVDFKLKLGIVDACQITQNMVTDFFRKYDFDNSIIASRNNAVLVVLKHKLHFNRLPDFDEAMDALSYTTKKVPIYLKLKQDLSIMTKIYFSVNQKYVLLI